MSAVSTMGVLKTKELGFASTLKAFGTASDANPLSLTFANQSAARTLSVPALSGNAEMLTDLSSIAATQLNVNGATAEASLADTDEFLFYDASATSNKKVTGANLKSYVGGDSVPSGTNGQIIVYDASNAAAAVGLSGDASIVASGAMTIANNAINSDKLAANAVVEAKIGTAAVTADKIAGGAVTNAKLGAASVSAAKLAPNSVTTGALQTGAVSSLKIVDGAVTTAKLDANAVSTAKIADDAVSAAKLADYPTTAGTIDASKLVVSDANKDLTGGRNLTLTGTAQAAEMAVGSSKWKFAISGNNMVLQYWDGSAWVTKQTFEPS